MNRIDTTDNGGLPYVNDDLRFALGQDTYDNDGIIGAINGLFKDIVPTGSNTNFIISGCVVSTPGAGLRDITEGWAYIDDGSGHQVVKVDAQQISSGTSTQHLVIADSYDSDGDKVFQDGDTVQTYIKRRGIFTNGSAPSTGANVADGRIDLSNILNGGIATKQVNIEDWNMYVTGGGTGSQSINVAHGISDYKKIRSVRAMIRDDADTVYWPLDRFNNLTSTVAGGIVEVTSTNIGLYAPTGGLFDTTSYNDDASFTRGYLIIDYVV